MAPFTSLRDLDGILSPNRMVLGLGKYTPALLTPFMQLMLKSVRRNPERYFEQITRQVPDMDREGLSNAVIRSTYVENMLEATRNHERDIVLEQILISRDWGVATEEIHVPVRLWHGDLDRHVPIGMGQRLADDLPDSELNIVPGNTTHNQTKPVL